MGIKQSDLVNAQTAIIADIEKLLAEIWAWDSCTDWMQIRDSTSQLIGFVGGIELRKEGENEALFNSWREKEAAYRRILQEDEYSQKKALAVQLANIMLIEFESWTCKTRAKYIKDYCSMMNYTLRIFAEIKQKAILRTADNKEGVST